MAALEAPKLGAVERDVPYRTVDGTPLAMDIYTPSAGGPWPGVLFIHGGGWMGGDKAPLPANPVEAGYLVASMNYRHYPAYRFPAMIEDVKAAIRFLRAHAARYGLDPARLALIGHSAGAHLAALAALADERAGWDSGPYPEQSSRVQAVIAFSGPTDLTRRFPDAVEDLKANVFGAEQLRSASPVSYASPSAPPFMIVHGDADELVPVEQAHLLHQSLLVAGARSELVVMQHTGHGLEPVGGPSTPSVEEVLGMTLAFLARMSTQSEA